MKTTFLFLVLVLIQFGLKAQDTLFIGTPQTDNLSDTLIDCYTYSCNPDSSHSYYCPISYNGVIKMYGIDNAIYEILIVTESQFVVLDTCVTMRSTAGGELILGRIFPSGFTVVVNGPEGGWVMIVTKVDPLQTYDSLPQPLFDLLTICATGTDLPITEDKWSYFDPYTLQIVTELRPNTAYLKRKKL
jgi:hypothetical protein